MTSARDATGAPAPEPPRATAQSWTTPPVDTADGHLRAAAETAAAFAHEVQNLLTVIGAGVEVAQGQVTDDPARAALATASDAVRLTAILARRFQHLCFEPPAAHSSPPIDLRPRLIAAAGLFQRMLGRDVTLVADVGPDVGCVRIEPDALDTALACLVTNARDAMREGGSIRLDARRRGDEVVVAITDDGLGMSGSQVAAAVEPFLGAKPRHRSAGLGLTCVRRIVTAAGGTLSIESAPGSGTTVEIRLPACGDGTHERADAIGAGR